MSVYAGGTGVHGRVRQAPGRLPAAEREQAEGAEVREQVRGPSRLQAGGLWTVAGGGREGVRRLYRTV